MAKKKAAIKKKLIPPREVRVKSRAYGEHTRAARGSKTPVGLNEVFAKYNAKTVAVNATAKRIHDLIKHCGKSFKEAGLWQVMLSRMRKATAEDVMGMLMALKGMDLNSKYPMGRFAHPFLSSAEWNEKGCTVLLHGGQPHIKSRDTEYRYEVFLLTLGKEAEGDAVVSDVSRWMEEGKDEDVIKFEFATTASVNYYVVCVHLMTGKDGRETGTLASRAMKVLGVGRVE